MENNTLAPDDPTRSEEGEVMHEDQDLSDFCDKSIDANTKRTADNTARLCDSIKEIAALMKVNNNLLGDLLVLSSKRHPIRFKNESKDIGKDIQLATPPPDPGTTRRKAAGDQGTASTPLNHVKKGLAHEDDGSFVFVKGEDVVKNLTPVFKIFGDPSKRGGLGFERIPELPCGWDKRPRLVNIIDNIKPSPERAKGPGVTILKYTDPLHKSGKHLFRVFLVKWKRSEDSEEMEELMLQQDITNLKNQNRDIFIQTGKMDTLKTVCVGARPGAIGPMIQALFAESGLLKESVEV